MDTLHHGLDGLRPAIEALMRLGGILGLSLAAVAPGGEPTYYANFSVRDVERGLPVTSETLFPACSLAKAVSAAAMGILVDEGKATREMLAKNAVSSFSSRDATLQQCTTLADIFNHRSGMSSAGHLVGGSEGNVLVARADIMRVVNDQMLLLDRLHKFAYNSTAYDLCGEAIEQLAGASVADFVQARIFQ